MTEDASIVKRFTRWRRIRKDSEHSAIKQLEADHTLWMSATYHSDANIGFDFPFERAVEKGLVTDYRIHALMHSSIHAL